MLENEPTNRLSANGKKNAKQKRMPSRTKKNFWKD